MQNDHRILALGALLLLLGCSRANTSAAWCTDDDQCRHGRVCVEGECVGRSAVNGRADGEDSSHEVPEHRPSRGGLAGPDASTDAPLVASDDEPDTTESPPLDAGAEELTQRDFPGSVDGTPDSKVPDAGGGMGGMSTEVGGVGGSTNNPTEVDAGYDDDGLLIFHCATQFGTSGYDRIHSMITDDSGNVLVGGGTDSALPGQTNAGGEDVFVQKYDGECNQLWSHQFGTLGHDSIFSVGTDAEGNVFAGGSVDGPLPGQVHTGSTDAFVRKYDKDGNELWTRQFGSSRPDSASVSADSQGNVFAAGGTWGALPGQTNGGYDDGDVFVRKYDSDGNELWTRQFGTPFLDGFLSMKADGNGNVVVSGYVETALPGYMNQGVSGTVDAFVRKYDGNGNELWTRQFGTAGFDYPRSISTDADGRIFVVGDTSGTLSGQSGQSSAGYNDAFVRAYDADGRELWTHQFGITDENDWGVSIGTDANGNVLVLILNSDPFVRKYDAAGTEVWTGQLGTDVADDPTSMAIDVVGNVFVGGATNGSLPEQNNAGSYDAFFLRLEYP